MKIIHIYDIFCFALLFIVNVLIIIGYHGIKDTWNEKRSFSGSVANVFWGNKKPKVYILYISPFLTISVERVFGRDWDTILIVKCISALLTLLFVFVSLFLIEIPDEEEMKQIKKFKEIY